MNTPVFPTLYKAVFPDVLEFGCRRGERELGGLGELL